MQHSESVNTQSIPLDNLARSQLNARRTGRNDGLDELKASILAHGLMQNLVVTEAADDTYRVIAGGRHLKALRALQAEGKLPTDHRVPCQIVSEERGLEMSLAENTVRLAMHPADEFEAFAALIGNGHTAAQVAERFGIEEKHVLKRMKLAGVAPELIAEYRAEKLTLETLTAFTVTDDRTKQLAVYGSLQEWQKDDPSEIRSILTEELLEAGSKLVRFVGLDAYLAAGGTTAADLFGDEVYLESPDLLHRLAAEKLDAIRHGLEAEGWGWVEVNSERDWEFVHRCGHIQPVLHEPPAELLVAKERIDAEIEEIQQALEDTESDALTEALDAAESRLTDVEEQLAGYVGYDPHQQALSGCFVSIGRDGEPHIEKGLVKPEHRKSVAKMQGSEDAADVVEKEDKKDRLPETLRRDLEAYRLQIAQAEIARHPALAFDLLVFNVACGVFDHVSPHDGPDVLFRQSYPRPSVQGETAASERLEAMQLSLEWLKLEAQAARFDEFGTLSQDEKLAILAYCTALTLKPKLAPADGDQPTAYDTALSLTGARVTDYWHPTKDNFLSRVTRDRLLAIGREIFGEAWAQARSKDKKAELVDQLDRAFADPEKHGRTQEQVEKLKRWLPAGMEFTAPAAPMLPVRAQSRIAA